MAKHKYYSKKENFISGSEQLLGELSAQSEGSILAPKGSCAAQEGPSCDAHLGSASQYLSSLFFTLLPSFSFFTLFS